MRGDEVAFLIVVCIVALSIGAIVHEGGPVGPNSYKKPEPHTNTSRDNGGEEITPKKLVRFDKASGDILWKKSTSSATGTSYMKESATNGKEELVIGSGVDSKKKPVMFLFKLKDNLLVAENIWTTDREEVGQETRDKLKGEVLGMFPQLYSK